MRYSRRRKKKTRGRIVVGTVVVLAAIGGWWWLTGSEQAPMPTDVQLAAEDAPLFSGAADQQSPSPELPAGGDVRLVADEEIIIAAGSGSSGTDTDRAGGSPLRLDDDQPTVQDEAASDPQDPTATRATHDARSGNRGIEDARRRIEAGKVIEARHLLNAMLNRDLAEDEGAEVRALLKRLADDTVFSRNVTPGDPLVDTYDIQAGDRLINVGKQFDVPYEILMEINGITDAARIRADQRIKVPRGPFHAKIHKSRFRLDVYLGDVYVRGYRVGLGNGGGTPEGVWQVKNRLSNPTYYPPASATDKRIIPPDDPTNPLGERWIGLEGLEGDARGREGYGIHGTIEPESIGKAVSLGCVRMHNEDVAFLFKLMLPGRSTVTILP